MDHQKCVCDDDTSSEQSSGVCSEDETSPPSSLCVESTCVSSGLKTEKSRIELQLDTLRRDLIDQRRRTTLVNALFQDTDEEATVATAACGFVEEDRQLNECRDM